MKTSNSNLLRVRAKEINKLPPWDEIIRGTLSCCRLTCGKSTCRCHRSKRYRHGPYWRVCVALKGKKRKIILIPATQVSRVKKGIVAYNRLWDGLCRISEINLAMLKAEL